MSYILANEWVQKVLVFASHIQWLDVAFLAALFVGVVWGYQKGFSQVIGSVVQAVFTLSIALEYSGAAVESFAIPSKGTLGTILRAVAFVALTFGSFLLSGFLLRIIGKILKIQLIPLIEKVGGILAGSIHVVLILGFASYCLLLLPLKDLQEAYQKKSFIGSYLADLVPKIHQQTRKVIPEAWRGQSS